MRDADGDARAEATGTSPHDPLHEHTPDGTPDHTRTEDPMDENPRPTEADTERMSSDDTGHNTPGAAVTGSDRRGVRVGTTVWGLVIAAIGLGLLAATLGYRFDVELALIALVAAAGAALLVGTVLTAVRRRD